MEDSKSTKDILDKILADDMEGDDIQETIDHYLAKKRFKETFRQRGREM